jgi:hypothetical protein
MGYYTRASGELEIQPSLTWTEIKDTPFLVNDNDNDNLWIVDVEEEQEDVEGGLLIHRRGTAVVPRYGDESRKYYDAETDLNQLVQTFPGHEFIGYFELVGEDGERSRLKVINGRVKRFEPRLVWPEGSE